MPYKKQDVAVMTKSGSYGSMDNGMSRLNQGMSAVTIGRPNPMMPHTDNSVKGGRPTGNTPGRKEQKQYMM